LRASRIQWTRRESQPAFLDDALGLTIPASAVRTL
jgi:hypothetical protein